MNPADTVLACTLAIPMALAGLLLGSAYFAALRRSVTALAHGGSWRAALVLTLGRIGAAAVFLWMAARLGATPLLAAFVGFLVARALALRLRHRTG